ncbi:2-desacetyl-2-hydroxyethyl bacteriochlorophyllide A dehydrogenase [Friedmanniella luteola]|uniref:2-desacetyl-2-hydroxyethyl bacteriochlorophyllide A dehydrogenase n=2 Tax=Friedmanniella luteola TaxID=546871 RepID=A0A1H1L929_9ACTN|nr:2-desacetyl-2-hydroxyethyl bacteriochlorophyllide A dehydrogenase [Friedmanniella luteola]
MWASVWHGPDDFRLEQRPSPACPPGWVLLQPELVGLCGTDLSIDAGHHGRARAPLVLGHEVVATVVDPRESNLAPGSRVALRPTLPCGECWPCRHGAPHTCRQLRLIGIDMDGGLAELAVAPAASLVPLSQQVPLTEAVLAEPLAVAIHAVERVGTVAGATVLVIGAGPIGILTGLVASSRGGRVLVSEPHAHRRGLAEDLGFETLDPARPLLDEVASLTDGVMSDVLFDCAAYPPLSAELSALVREHGSIVLVALYPDPTPLDLHAITFAEQAVLGSRVYTPDDLTAAVNFIDTGQLDLSRLPIGVFGLDDARGAVDAARRGAALKIAVQPTSVLSPRG